MCLYLPQVDSVEHTERYHHTVCILPSGPFLPFLSVACFWGTGLHNTAEIVQVAERHKQLPLAGLKEEGLSSGIDH